MNVPSVITIEIPAADDRRGASPAADYRDDLRGAFRDVALDSNGGPRRPQQGKDSRRRAGSGPRPSPPRQPPDAEREEVTESDLEAMKEMIRSMHGHHARDVAAAGDDHPCGGTAATRPLSASPSRRRPASPDRRGDDDPPPRGRRTSLKRRVRRSDATAVDLPLPLPTLPLPVSPRRPPHPPHGHGGRVISPRSPRSPAATPLSPVSLPAYPASYCCRECGSPGGPDLQLPLPPIDLDVIGSELTFDELRGVYD